MDKQLLIETLEDSLKMYDSYLDINCLEKEWVDFYTKKVSDIEKLLSELTTEPTIEEQMKEFESDFRKAATGLKDSCFHTYTDRVYMHNAIRDAFSVWQIARGYKP